MVYHINTCLWIMFTPVLYSYKGESQVIRSISIVISFHMKDQQHFPLNLQTSIIILELALNYNLNWLVNKCYMTRPKLCYYWTGQMIAQYLQWNFKAVQSSCCFVLQQCILEKQTMACRSTDLWTFKHLMGF